MNVNFHLEHHLLVSVPWFRLPKLHRMLGERGALGDAVLEPGYASGAVEGHHETNQSLKASGFEVQAPLRIERASRRHAPVVCRSPSRELRWGADAQGGAPYVFQDPMDPNHLIGFEVELADGARRTSSACARGRCRASGTSCSSCSRAATSTSRLNGIEVADEKQRVATLTRPYYVAPSG